MRITIVAIGSRGDVQPCVALGRGLSQAGCDVKIATYRVFASLVESYGLGFAPIEGDPRQAMEAQAGQQWLESGRSLVKFISRMRSLATYESLDRSLQDAVEACRGADAILYTPLGAAGYHVAESMEVPAVYLLVQPFTRSREMASIFSPALPLGGAYNRATYFLAEQLLWQTVRVTFNRWRQETLGLKPMSFSGPFDRLYREHVPFIYGFSRHVIPRPRDWPAWHQITGYWFLNGVESWSPPDDLLRFLSAGSQPVAIGFGSMSGSVARDLAELAIEAVALSERRAVLLGGWASAHDLDLPDSIYAMESAPHEWLFPRMAAVVHHGGAGTTAAGLRAGRPSVIVPFFGDQPFWGRRVHALGAGPEPIFRSHLTAERLAEAITRAVTDPHIQNEAAVLGEAIRAEDGVTEAVSIICRLLDGSQPTG